MIVILRVIFKLIWAHKARDCTHLSLAHCLSSLLVFTLLHFMLS